MGDFRSTESFYVFFPPFASRSNFVGKRVYVRVRVPMHDGPQPVTFWGGTHTHKRETGKKIEFFFYYSYSLTLTRRRNTYTHTKVIIKTSESTTRERGRGRVFLSDGAALTNIALAVYTKHDDDAPISEYRLYTNAIILLSKTLSVSHYTLLRMK